MKYKYKSILLLRERDWSQEKKYFLPALQLFFDAWSKVAQEMGIAIYRSTPKFFNKDSFTRVHVLKNGKWEKIVGSVSPGVVYDKGSLYDPHTQAQREGAYLKRLEIAAKFPIVNDPEFMHLFSSKLNQYLVFGQYMPQSAFVYPGQKIQQREPIVVKGFVGSGGFNVKIFKTKNFVFENRGLLQEFVKASKNGRVEDYRVLFLGTKPVYLFTRCAKKGSFFTNYHQGGRVTFLDMKSMPKLIAHAKKIAKPLGIFRKAVYSLDFMIDSRNKKPYLIELNENPGSDVFTEENRKPMEKFARDLTRYLLSD